MAAGIRDLKLWQEAVALAADALVLARQSARRETRPFTDRLIISALAVAERIADGHAQPGAAEQLGLFVGARRALLELETQLAVARQAGVITPAALAQHGARVQSVARLLAGYTSYVERQLADERVAAAAAASRTAREASA